MNRSFLLKCVIDIRMRPPHIWMASKCYVSSIRMAWMLFEWVLCYFNESFKDPNGLCFVSSSIRMSFPVIQMTHAYSIHSFKWGTVAFECVTFCLFKCFSSFKFIQINFGDIRMAVGCKSLTPDFHVLYPILIPIFSESLKLIVLRWE